MHAPNLRLKSPVYVPEESSLMLCNVNDIADVSITTNVDIPQLEDNGDSDDGDCDSGPCFRQFRPALENVTWYDTGKQSTQRHTTRLLFTCVATYQLCKTSEARRPFSRPAPAGLAFRPGPVRGVCTQTARSNFPRMREDIATT